MRHGADIGCVDGQAKRDRAYQAGGFLVHPGFLIAIAEVCVHLAVIAGGRDAFELEGFRDILHRVESRVAPAALQVSIKSRSISMLIVP